MHMKRPFIGPMCLIGCVMLSTLTSFQIGAEPPKRADSSDGSDFSPGWKPASPRDEIRPSFSFDPKGGPKSDGSLIIAEDEREGLHGWWQKTYPIVGGRHYHFQALRKVQNVKVPRRSAVVRIVWQDDK